MRIRLDIDYVKIETVPSYYRWVYNPIDAETGKRIIFSFSPGFEAEDLTEILPGLPDLADFGSEAFRLKLAEWFLAHPKVEMGDMGDCCYNRPSRPLDEWIRPHSHCRCCGKEISERSMFCPPHSQEYYKGWEWVRKYQGRNLWGSLKKMFPSVHSLVREDIIDGFLIR